MLTPHIVKAKGNTYCYAWRGGPRMKTMPGSPDFEAECEAISRVSLQDRQPEIGSPYEQTGDIDA